MVAKKPTGEGAATLSGGIFVGRIDELLRLRALLTAAGPRVLFLHGLAGSGKSALVHRFAACEDSGDEARVLVLDCREIEPTEDSFLAAVAHHVGQARAFDGNVDGISPLLGRAARRVVLCLDHYEVFRLLDTWLRQRFLPALPQNVSVLMSGREEPNPAWSRLPSGIVELMHLGSLGPDESRSLIRALGVGGESVGEVYRIAHGHPLTLVLGALTAKERPAAQIHDVTMNRLLDEFTSAYVDELGEDAEDVLEAAAVVRRINLPLLEAILPTREPWKAFETLQRLPFVDLTSDGLALHSVVQESIAARLKSAAPSRHRELRERAWTYLREQLRIVPPVELWRHTADMIYLLENPAVREALFPTDAHRFAIEPATPSDANAIEALIERHETSEAAELLESWWTRSPHAFRVARGDSGDVVGFAIFGTRADLRRFSYDPVVALWRDHMQRHPIAPDRKVLLVRRWLTWEDGDLPSETQASMWLDLKRTYMELRPALRRVYSSTDHPEIFGPVLHQLAAEALPGGAVEIQGRHHQAFCLDMGPASVDGWLTSLAARELGINVQGLLDVQQRQLLVNGRRVDLTPREFEVIAYLSERSGAAVSRTELLASIWGYDQMAGSNVVDAVIHSLRRKLGSHSDLLETVRGVGYRLSTV